ncbi:MAG: hypothetical protein ACF8PN_16595 [Phycisphaerales bacterium]
MSTLHETDRRRWIEHLRHLADPVLSREDGDTALNAALGRPWSAEAPLIAWRLGKTRASAPARIVGHGDVRLWWALLRDDREAAAALVAVEADGPIFDLDKYTAVEVWTESELCALHALSWLRGRIHPEQLNERIERAVDWHIERTQPDNATNHAWGLHVFLMRGSPEGRHFAETLLTNCMALQGEPDPLSAWILSDAAAALEELSG